VVYLTSILIAEIIVMKNGLVIVIGLIIASELNKPNEISGIRECRRVCGDQVRSHKRFSFKLSFNRITETI